MSWWVHDLFQAQRYTELVSWIFWVIFSITLHELAHGWAAIWQGDNTPRAMGRMTANPLVHMGHLSLLVFLFVGIAWGMMPVDPSRFRWRRRGRIVVSGAGPAMNIALAFTSLTLLVLWLKVGPSGTPIYENLATFLWTGGWLNILLALFNLLPIPPLDGASILSGLSYRIYQFYQKPQLQMVGMFLLLIVFMSGCGGFLFGVGGIVGAVYVDILGIPLGNPPVFDVVG